MFFNVRIVSKSPAELSPPIGAFMELRYNANLPCLVNLALSVWKHYIQFALKYIVLKYIIANTMIQ